MAEQKFVNLEGLTHYDEKIKEYLASKDAETLQSAKDYVLTVADAAGTAATKVAELENGKVKTNTEAIAKLNGDATTEGSVAKAVADAKSELNASIAGVQSDVDALEDYVGTIPAGATATDIVGYVQEKTSGIATTEGLQELTDRVASAEGEIDAIQADYLKAADKTELEGKITAAQTAAGNAQTHSEGVASDLSTAKKALEDADSALAERTAVLEGKITGLSGAMHFEGVKDSVPTTDFTGYETGDVIVVGEKEYVFDGSKFVEFGDVSAEGERLSALEGRATTVEGKVSTLEGEMDTAQADIDAVEADVTDLKQAKDNLEAADTALSGRIATLEGKFTGTGSVEEQIAAAKAEAIATAGTNADTKDAAILKSAKDYTDGKITTVTEAADALTARVSTAETNITNLQGRMSTAEGEIDDLQTAVETTLPADIAAAKKAGDDAQATANTNAGNITTLQGKVTANESTLSAHGDRLTALETKVGDGFVAITNAQIDALFQN